jgi:tRNA pseudouridine38-40 synthase
MVEAASYLVGEHDFSAFRASECQAKSPIKRLHVAEVKMQGAYFVFDFSATAFLQHQVRNMIGALIYVGKGAYSPIYIKELLLKRDRTLSPPTFSPCGLYLTSVGYDSKWGLPNDSAKAQHGMQVLI